MNLEYTCERCGKSFLTELQFRGHTATHADYQIPRGAKP